MTQFAPSPEHGAAYSVAIGTVGGVNEIGACDSQAKYQAMKRKLAALELWSRTQTGRVKIAYQWAIDRVDADLKARLEVHENAKAVSEALAVLPQPEALPDHEETEPAAKVK